MPTLLRDAVSRGESPFEFDTFASDFFLGRVGTTGPSPLMILPISVVDKTLLYFFSGSY